MYFSKSWPPLRQIFPLSHSASYFWNNVFFPYNGSWSTASNLWGASFFGLSPFMSLLFFIVFAILFAGLNVFLVFTGRWHSGISCRLCRKAICKHCRKGELCISCYRATKFIRNVKSLASIQESIIRKRQSYYRMVEYILDIVLPGSGVLFGRRHAFGFGVFLIILTCLVYATFLFFKNVHSIYPLWVISDKLETIPYFLGIYNAVFCIRALFSAFRKKETVLS
jgi:hypothetical protein